MAEARGPGALVLRGWAVLTAAAALVLLLSGGVVTSKGVGMAVPDWPTTFGYNMFLFPVSKWVGGIFYEHSHRLIASGVGFMTLVLAALAWITGAPRTLRLFSLWLVAAVLLQGLLGGLRVVWAMNDIGIFHAMLGQSFFSALCVFCLLCFRRPAGERPPAEEAAEAGPRLRSAVHLAVVLIFAQLALGATMRHEHIGLAVPDFPLAYGRVIPDTSPSALQAINVERAAEGLVPVRASHILVHLAHRAVAVVVCLAVAGVVLASRGARARVRGVAWTWALLVALQFALGAWTVLSGKSVAIATAHMALGALILALGVVFAVRLELAARPSPAPRPEPLPAAAS